jgi:hypothetical protein
LLSHITITKAIAGVFKCFANGQRRPKCRAGH